MLSPSAALEEEEEEEEEEEGLYKASTVKEEEGALYIYINIYIYIYIGNGFITRQEVSRGIETQSSSWPSKRTTTVTSLMRNRFITTPQIYGGLVTSTPWI